MGKLVLWCIPGITNGCNAQVFSQSNELRYRSRFELAHHVVPMDLDRVLARAEIERNLFVQLSADHMGKDFTLAGCQALVAGAGLAPALPHGTICRIPSQRPSHRLEQHRRFDWFREEVDGASLHRVRSLGNVAMSSQEDDGHRVL